MFMSGLIAVLLHELAHATMAKFCGYRMDKITLMPYGAVIYGGESFHNRDGIKIAISGPLMSLTLALLTMSVWWLFPSSYNYLYDFLFANLSLFCINILPCFPLDGARVVLGLVKDKVKALTILKICGIVLSLIMIGLGIASFFYKVNITLLNLGVFLLIGTITSSKKEEYYLIASRMDSTKDYKRGVVERKIYVSYSTPIFVIFGYISNRYLTTFVVKSQDGEDITFTEQEFSRLILSNEGIYKVEDILKYR